MDEIQMPAPFGDIRQLLTRFYEELWNAWDDTAVEEVLAVDFMFRGSLGDETIGLDGWRRYRDMIRTGSPDFHNEIQDIVAEGSRAAVRLLYSGTHQGDLLGLRATQRRFSYAGAAFFAAHDRRLKYAWVLGDIDGLRRQISAAAL